jgi:hypothetical protein
MKSKGFIYSEDYDLLLSEIENKQELDLKQLKETSKKNIKVS